MSNEGRALQKVPEDKAVKLCSSTLNGTVPLKCDVRKRMTEAGR
jgi:hypothetical protein